MLTREALIAVASQYWFSDRKWNFADELSPETTRLHQRWREALEKDRARWDVFLRDLKDALPGFTTGSYMAACDGSWRCLVYDDAGLPKPRFRYVLVGSMSILAPVYVVYAVEYGFDGEERGEGRLYFEPFGPSMAEPARVIGEKLENHFGVEKLPQSVWETPVPFICNWQEPPDTTLFHALFSSEPKNLP